MHRTNNKNEMELVLNEISIDKINRRKLAPGWYRLEFSMGGTKFSDDVQMPNSSEKVRKNLNSSKYVRDAFQSEVFELKGDTEGVYFGKKNFSS